MNGATICLLTALAVFGVRAAPDTTVCDPSAAMYRNYSGSLPSIPTKLTWRLELNVIDKSQTYEVQQFIHYDLNTASAHSYFGGRQTYYIMKFDSDELITITWGPDMSVASATCSVATLSTSNKGFIPGTGFEAQPSSMVEGKLHLATPLESLGLNGKNPIRYLGKQTLQDGVKTDVWEGCMYYDSTKTTSKVTWYFSDPGTWYTAMGRRATPIAMSVVGSTFDPATNMPLTFNHQYNYADFRPWLIQGSTDSFMIPEGIYCKNDKNFMDLPSIPTHFSLKSELIDSSTKYINWIAEYYDADLNLTRYDYKNPTNHKYGNGTLTRIHDFNTGLAYIIDIETQRCNFSTIQQSGYDDDNVGFNVRIRSPKEFLYLDKYQYNYVGQRVERGIACDVWVAQRTDWPPPGPSYATNWEYYFSAGTMESVGTRTVFNVPVKLRISASAPSIDMQYNFYEFNPDRSSFHDYNIGACFDEYSRADFVMVIPGNHRRIVWANLVIFKRLVVLGVSSVALVSPLRVTNIMTSFNSSGLLLSFSLLDKAPISGDVQNPFIQPTLQQAISNLKPSLDDGTFTILVQDPTIGGGFDTLVPTSYSISGPTARFPRSVRSVHRQKRDASSSNVVKIHFQNKNDQGMTSGALAGLAIGVLLGGIIVGLVVFLIIFKMVAPGGNAPQSFTNPSSD